MLGLNGAGKTTLLRILGGVEKSDTGEVRPGHGLKLGYYAQEHETLDLDRTVVENLQVVRARPHRDPGALRARARSCSRATTPTSPPACCPAARRPASRSRPSSSRSANVLLLDEPTNNLDPASREEILAALRGYAGAVVLVSHDEGAVAALDPERVLLLPDGDEDLWNPAYLDLIALA